jgi:hypothetical protein
VLGGSATGYIRASANYVGDRENLFSASAAQPRILMGGYTQVNALAGVQYRAWTANCFANNITDKRGALQAGSTSTSTLPAGSAIATTYIQPRTIGLSVAYAF